MDPSDIDSKGNVFSGSMRAIRRALQVGLDLQERLPQIAEDFRAGLNHPQIVDKYGITTLHGISDGVASNAVGYALRGHPEDKYRVEAFDGLIETPELDDLVAQHQKAHYKALGHAHHENGTALFSLTHEERVESGRRYGMVSALVRGFVPWVPQKDYETHRDLSEKQFAYNLSTLHRIGKGADWEKIREILNDTFHDGEEVRTVKAISSAVKKYKMRLRERRTTIDHLADEVQRAVEAKDYDQDLSGLVGGIITRNLRNDRQGLKVRFLGNFGVRVKSPGSLGSLGVIVNNYLYFHELGIKKINQVFRNSVAASSYDMRTLLKPRIENLLSWGVPECKIGKVFENAPRLTSNIADLAMKINVGYFRKRVKVCDEKIGGMIVARPQLLTYSIDNLMEPCIQYLESIGITDERLSTVAARYPTIISSRVETLRPKIEYLMRELGVTIDYLISVPSIAGASLEKKIKPRHAFVVHNEVDLDDISIGSMLAKPDDVFAVKIARSTPREYRQFKAEYFANAA